MMNDAYIELSKRWLKGTLMEKCEIINLKLNKVIVKREIRHIHTGEMMIKFKDVLIKFEIYSDNVDFGYRCKTMMKEYDEWEEINGLRLRRISER